VLNESLVIGSIFSRIDCCQNPFFVKISFFLKFVFFGIRLFVKIRSSKFKFTTCTGWKVRIYHISLRYTQKHDLFYQFQLGKKNNNKTTMFFGFSIQKVLNSRRKKCINKKNPIMTTSFVFRFKKAQKCIFNIKKISHKHKKYIQHSCEIVLNNLQFLLFQHIHFT